MEIEALFGELSPISFIFFDYIYKLSLSGVPILTLSISAVCVVVVPPVDFVDVSVDDFRLASFNEKNAGKCLRYEFIRHGRIVKELHLLATITSSISEVFRSFFFQLFHFSWPGTWLKKINELTLFCKGIYDRFIKCF